MTNNMNILYIFEGPENIAIVRGTEPEGDDKKNLIVKHKGIFGEKCRISGICDFLFCEEKSLIINGKISTKMKVRRVVQDLLTQRPYTTDINPQILAKYRSLQNEIQRLRTLCKEYESMLITLEQQQLFDEKMKNQFKSVGEAKGQLVTYQDYTGFGFGGLGGFKPHNLNIGNQE